MLLPSTMFLGPVYTETAVQLNSILPSNLMVNSLKLFLFHLIFLLQNIIEIGQDVD